jgi:hypothetical protein
MPDYCVKISVKSDHHALQNLSSNPTANFSESDNNLITFPVTQNGEWKNCQILILIAFL